MPRRSKAKTGSLAAVVLAVLAYLGDGLYDASALADARGEQLLELQQRVTDLQAKVLDLKAELERARQQAAAAKPPAVR